MGPPSRCSSPGVMVVILRRWQRCPYLTSCNMRRKPSKVVPVRAECRGTPHCLPNKANPHPNFVA
jgi:hypothetical protein